MKSFLIKIFILVIFLMAKVVYANKIDVDYSVSVGGIKIGEFAWYLNINKDEYYSEINLKNSGILSSLYKFSGKYTCSGLIKDNKFLSKDYKQYWKTNKKVKVIEMTFGNYLKNLIQDPEEIEKPRINLYKLYQHSDPISSFINILNGNYNSKTIDGRRVYDMEKINGADPKIVTVEINNYKNIWADHKRNDLEKIQLYLDKKNFLPDVIKIHFKKRVFKLKKI